VPKRKYIFVLYSSKTAPSGRVLAKSLLTDKTLSSKYAMHFGVAATLKKVARQYKGAPEFVINIGETHAEVIPQGTGQVLNRPSLVARSSNKRGARILFRDEKVPAPELWLNPEDISRAGFPVIARTTNHSKAKGLWYCKNKAEASRAKRLGATHFLKFIKNTREFRVHIVAAESGNAKNRNYASIKISEKIYQGKKRNISRDIVKNHDNGYVFMYPNRDANAKLLNRVRELGKKAVQVLEMDWGAVDIMYCEDDASLYVLEINSSPCLTDETANTLQKYSEWMLHLMGIKTKHIVEKTAPAPPKRKKMTKKRRLPKLSSRDMKKFKKVLRRIPV